MTEIAIMAIFVYIQPEQILAIKGVHKANLTRVQEAIVREANPELGLQHEEDKDPSCAGQLFVYHNNGSGIECMGAQAKLKRLADDKWPEPENHEEE